MNAVLENAMPVKNRRGMTFNHPPAPIVLRALERPSLEVLQATFPSIDCIGPDSSVTLICSLYFGMPIIGEKARNGDKTIVQIIDDRLEHSHPPFLGIQHAWELCRRQHEIPFLRLPHMRRIWFYGLSLYEVSGGEFRPAMVRVSDSAPWATQLVPACDYYPATDCLAFAQL